MLFKGLDLSFPFCRKGWLCCTLLALLAAPAAAQLPEPENLTRQAVDLHRGEGGRQDYFRAFDLYCVAALHGDALAAYGLGNLYLDGLGRTKDEARAAGWFREARKNGHADAGAVLDGRLAGAAAAADPECPLVVAQPDRKRISTWVHLLAPFYGLRPDLVKSVIQVESNFNAQAKSPKDAIGLMQLIKPTAKRFGVDDIWDPLQNIKGGMAYLAWLKQHYKKAKGRKPGRTRLMLAAYNAGEHAVRKHRGIPPYEETQKYVRRVVSVYSKYIRARKGLTRSARASSKATKQKRTGSRRVNRKLGWNREFRKGYIPLSSLK